MSREHAESNAALITSVLYSVWIADQIVYSVCRCVESMLNQM